MAQLRQGKERFEASGVDVKVVTFDSLRMAKSYVERKNLTWPMLVDEALTLYQAYGFERATLGKLLGPVTTLKYVWLILTGTKPGSLGKDIRQMGGNVLIDPDGVVRMHHQSVTPHDRPNIDQILDCVSTSAKSVTK